MDTKLIAKILVVKTQVKVKIRQQKGGILLDLRSVRKTPEDVLQLLESDFNRARKEIRRKVAGDGTIGPVFKDYMLGPLTPIETPTHETPTLWRDESSAEVVDSHQYLTSFVFDWAMKYCVDDEGLIPILDFNVFNTHLFRHRIAIRNGVSVGQKAMGFGAYFSPDSPHPNEKPGDTRPRKPFSL